MGHPEGGQLAHWSCVGGGYRLPQSGDGEGENERETVTWIEFTSGYGQASYSCQPPGGPPTENPTVVPAGPEVALPLSPFPTSISTCHLNAPGGSFHPRFFRRSRARGPGLPCRSCPPGACTRVTLLTRVRAVTRIASQSPTVAARVVVDSDFWGGFDRVLRGKRDREEHDPSIRQ